MVQLSTVGGVWPLPKAVTRLPGQGQSIPPMTKLLADQRLGCRIDQPEYPGIDLAALCVSSS